MYDGPGPDQDDVFINLQISQELGINSGAGEEAEGIYRDWTDDLGHH
jgi:hypothetical protein